MSSRSERIDALPPELRERLRHRLTGRSGRSTGIPHADRAAPLPLSFAQQRLWFLDKFEPGSAEYNSGLALRLTGRLDEAALLTALRVLAERHESLRTTFAENEGAATQVVHPTGEI